MQDSATQFTEFVTGGAVTGAWVSLSMGGMGLTFSGTAVGIGFTPVAAAGAFTGAASYGLFRAVVEGDASAFSAAALGVMGGASVSLQVGGMGLAFKGTAMSLGIAPVTAAGAVVGLAIYGLIKMLDDAPKEAASDVFARMEDKVSTKEAYLQALMEMDPIFADEQWLEQFAALEEDLATLKRALLDNPTIVSMARQELLMASQLLSQGRKLELEFTQFNSATVAVMASSDFSTKPVEDQSSIAIPDEKVWRKFRTIQGHFGQVNAITLMRVGHRGWKAGLSGS